MKKYLPLIIVPTIIILVLLFLTYYEPPKRDILDGSIWKVINLDDAPLVEHTTLTIRFARARVFGSSGCNTFKGRYEVEENGIQITHLVLTTNNCMNPQVMQNERDFTGYLRNSTAFTLSGNGLSIITDNGEMVEFLTMVGD